MNLHDALADVLVEILGAIEVDGKPVNAYKWSEGGIKRPAAVVELPTFRRVAPDEPEDHLGERDWRMVYPVAFYVEMGRNPAAAQARLAQGVEDFIKAVDQGTAALTELSTDLKVVEATPFVEPTQAEAVTLIGYETTVSILSFQ